MPADQPAATSSDQQADGTPDNATIGYDENASSNQPPVVTGNQGAYDDGYDNGF